MKLDVLIEGNFAGHLDVPPRRRAVFTYDDAYRRDPRHTPLSTRFPLQQDETSDPSLRMWLLGLLPDDARVLESLRTRFQVYSRDPLHLLTTPIGADCAGAVQFCPPEHTERLLRRDGGLRSLTDDEVFNWLWHLRTDPAYRPVTHEYIGGFSLAGMQPKLALRELGNRWALPWGAEPTSHILKITRNDLYPHEALLEHLTMRTAARLAIAAAPTKVITRGDLEAVVVTRYDRAPDGADRLQRIHQEDYCQALGAHPNEKYEYHQGAPTLSDVAALLRSFSNTSADALRSFRDMVIFQWLVVGTDAHWKNFSLLLSGPAVVQAPLYDSCTWLPYRRASAVEDLRLPMRFGEDHTLNAADRPGALRRLAAILDLPAPETLRRCEELSALLPAALEAAVNDLPAHQQDIAQVQRYLTEQPQRAAHCEQVARQATLHAGAASSAPASASGTQRAVADPWLSAFSPPSAPRGPGR